LTFIYLFILSGEVYNGSEWGHFKGGLKAEMCSP